MAEEKNERQTDNSEDSKKNGHDLDEDLKLTEEEETLVDHAEKAYTTGRELKDWWDDVRSRNAFTNKFPLLEEFDRPDTNFGYLEKAKLGNGNGRQPVMGEYQDLFYDSSKEPPTSAARKKGAEWMNEQIREFALRYFLRATSSRMTEAYPEKGDPAPGFGWVSQCPKDLDERKDIGFYQLLYKLKDDDKVGKFAKADQTAFVDVREIGTKYKWVLAKARLFDFQLFFYPFGRHVPPLVILDNKEHLYILFTPYFNADVQNPEKGVLGEYGMGFAIVPPPATSDLVTIGPQVFTMGFNYFRFRVYETGEVRASIEFCCNQLDGILPLPVSPVDWGLQLAHLTSFGWSSRLLKPFQKQIEDLPFSKATVDPVFGALKLLNLVTGDAAARDYCLSKEEVFKFILRKHGTVFNHLIGDSVRVWRQIPDWLDTGALPRWVVRGEKP